MDGKAMRKPAEASDNDFTAWLVDVGSDSVFPVWVVPVFAIASVGRALPC